jgi:predicted DNA-binding transcriptional regulator AlpA
MSAPTLEPIPPPEPRQPAGRKISAREAAELLGICREGLLQLLQRHQDFPRPYRYSETGRRTWDLRELLAWVESRREKGDPDAA